MKQKVRPKTIRVDIEITEDVNAKIKELAEHTGRSQRKMISALIGWALKQKQLADYSSLF